MSSEAMEMESSSEQSTKKKAETLQALATGALASSVAKLSGSARGIPSEKDYHFFYNFDEFKVPIREIAEKSQLMLESIGSSRYLWGKEMGFPEDSDEAYDWLVNVNDEVFERFDVSVDEFKRQRKKEEESGMGISSIDSENGFQLVYGKKKKGGSHLMEKEDGKDLGGVKMASRDKNNTGARPRVPFHVPTIPRPQDEFNILVNNSNQPFEHVWLQKSDDGSRFIHPLEKLSELDFVDKNIGDVEPLKPLPIESTPFKMVEEVKELKELAAKLRDVNEFAVDLEHNQYRSFQGLTCLMQISTRMEDFIVDTLKLRVHVGPYLREIFKDPSKKKVMHGADRDIAWLQRDFGVYVCNMFDTGQASRVLKLERNSLEYLLNHFVGVTANKEYQNADWRLRPLPDEMVRYAREDTHYLLHIYDLMRNSLLSATTEPQSADALLIEVYKRSYDICMQLYEKEILTDSSYLHIYGLQGTDFNSQQLAIVAGLCEWRDVIARAEDESTGFILPNKALLEIARQMPVTTGKLRRLVKSKHHYVERNLGSVVSIIRHSIENAAAFEFAAEQLKKGRTETVPEENIVVADGSEVLPPPVTHTSMQTASSMTESIDGGNTVKGKMAEHLPESVHVKEEAYELGSSSFECGRHGQGGSYEIADEAGNIKKEWNSHTPDLLKESFTDSGQMRATEMGMSHLSKPVTEAAVQVLKKPSRAFGALLGKSAPKRKLDPDQKDKAEIKVEQIKSSVNLPFQSFFCVDEQLKSHAEVRTKALEIQNPKETVSQTDVMTNLEEIILLESHAKDHESTDGVPESHAKDHESTDGVPEASNDGLEKDDSAGSASELDTGDEPISLSGLSSSFQKCFQSINQERKSRQVERSQESGGLQLKPFDYAAARKEVKFGEERKKQSGAEGDEGRRSLRKSSASGRVERDEGTEELPQGRRRQAFPATGNRSSTFR
ncbi:hypothetical protein HHK36_016979 [Tetracentron sinense]|uniref:HRDC domain-containing protein n=1 Tax=Tetracentron sinense TaxID=13715 RepID=A0A835DC25_TETSI|nr:hypothetical protein HHK36_016979 [Tetracentron sinense]